MNTSQTWSSVHLSKRIRVTNISRSIAPLHANTEDWPKPFLESWTNECQKGNCKQFSSWTDWLVFFFSLTFRSINMGSMDVAIPVDGKVWKEFFLFQLSNFFITVLNPRYTQQLFHHEISLFKSHKHRRSGLRYPDFKFSPNQKDNAPFLTAILDWVFEGHGKTSLNCNY